MGFHSLAVIAFVSISLSYGLDRQDSFEIAVISIDWLVWLSHGVLWSILFRRGFTGTAIITEYITARKQQQFRKHKPASVG